MPSFMHKVLLGALPTLALAASTPSVEVSNGVYQGVSNEHYQQEFFLGIPYAQPPVGDLRFASPKALTEKFDEPRAATQYGAACIGYGSDTEALDGPLSEDCLTLNVVRPAGTQPGDDLPVGIWVHGGSYKMGSSQDVRYNLTNIVEQSVQEGNPIIAVSINYRVSYWGFLFGEEMAEEGSSNMGFKDQRMAFQWIHDNAVPFGGSADKITIWGESAGARSLGMHLIAYDGKHDGLFSGAVLESGSPVARFFKADDWQEYFEAVLEKTDCDGACDPLACLRELPWETLNGIFNGTTPVNVTSPELSAVIDGDFMTGPPVELLQAGKFAHVPLLMGNNFDEGTAYGKQGINTTEEFADYLKTLDLGEEQISNILSLYPDDPELGIPLSLLGRPVGAFLSYGEQWKRSAAFAGDYQQHAGRRLLAQVYSGADLDVYTYMWNVNVNGVPSIFGATHFQEVAFVFNNTDGVGYPTNPFENKPESYKELADLMSRMWVTFMAKRDPNVDNAVAWPKYSLSQPENLVFDANKTGLSYVAKDDDRVEAIKYVIEEVFA